MSLRTRVGDLARLTATTVTRNICNIMITQLQQTQTGSMRVKKVNKDGTVTVTLPDGSEQSMTYNGNTYPAPGMTVLQQGPGIVQ